ncbi:MAG: RDD family protein [Archangiaceae bacterium]|nr:RDD family protein [Archangiaceae bacterium]
MSDDPKKPDPRVPSFGELAGRRPAAPERSMALGEGEEEKTATIDGEVLKRVLQQSQRGAAIAPAPKPPDLAIDANTRLPLAPARVAPPAPGSRPAAPPPPVAPAAPPRHSQVPTRAAPPAPLPAAHRGGPESATDPMLPPARPPLARAAPPAVAASRATEPSRPSAMGPPPGSVPMDPRDAPTVRQAPLTDLGPVHEATERMRPITPDAIPPARASPGRGMAPIQTAAPRVAQPLPDPSVPTVHDGRPLGARPSPPVPASGLVTQPELEAAFDPEPKTRNERTSLRGQPKTPSPEEVAPHTDPVAEAPPRDEGSRPTVEVVARPASGFSRLGAYLIDAAVLLALDVALAVGVFTVGKAAPLPPGLGTLDQLAMRVHDSGPLVAAVAVLALGLAAAYTTLFAVAWSGRTLGRRLMGLHLVDARGTAPSPLRALARACLSLLSFALFGTGFWLGLLDRRGQALHDKLCSTFVVRLGPSRT